MFVSVTVSLVLAEVDNQKPGSVYTNVATNIITGKCKKYAPPGTLEDLEVCL